MTFSLKIASILSVSCSLRATTFSHFKIFKNQLIQFSEKQKFFSVIENFEFTREKHIFWLPIKSVGIGAGYQVNRFVFCIKPFYKKAFQSKNWLDIFQKTILSCDLIAKASKFLTHFSMDLSTNEIKRSSEVEVDIFYDLLKRILEDVNKDLVDPSIFRSCGWTMFLVEQLKQRLGPFEGQSIKYINLFDDNIKNIIKQMQEELSSKRKTVNNNSTLKKNITISAIKHKRSMVKNFCFLEQRYRQELLMDRAFFEAKDSPFWLSFQTLMHSYDQTYNEVCLLQKKEQDAFILEGELKSLHKKKEELKHFVFGACYLIDFLNFKFSCIYYTFLEIIRLSKEVELTIPFINFERLNPRGPVFFKTKEKRLIRCLGGVCAPISSDYLLQEYKKIVEKHKTVVDGNINTKAKYKPFPVYLCGKNRIIKFRP